MGIYADSKRATFGDRLAMLADGAAGRVAEHAAVSAVQKARVAALLVTGRTVPEIASELRIAPALARTLARDPDVVAEIKDTFAARRSAAARELDAGASEAVRFLRETLNDPINSTRDRIKAAVELLDRGGIPRGLKLDIHNANTGTTIEIDNVSALSDAEIEAAARLALERRGRVLVT